MPIEIGHIEAIFRYPVKSMRGERLGEATLGWHGIEGDRRFAFRKIDDRGGFPGSPRASYPTWSCLRRSAVATIYLRMCARRMGASCQYSAKSWLQRLDGVTARPCR